MDKLDLINHLKKHLKWIKGEEGGEKACLHRADLRWADLHGADLRGADLRWADLRDADLRDTNIKVFHGGEWIAFIDPEFIRIGCQFFTVSEWDGFSDERIDKMASGALEYWKENKEIIMSISKKLQEKHTANKETDELTNPHCTIGNTNANQGLHLSARWLAMKKLKTP